MQNAKSVGGSIGRKAITRALIEFSLVLHLLRSNLRCGNKVRGEDKVLMTNSVGEKLGLGDTIMQKTYSPASAKCKLYEFCAC